MECHTYPYLTEAFLSWLDGLCSTYLSIWQSQCAEAFQGRGIVVPESQVISALAGQCPMEPVPGFLTEFEDLLNACSDDHSDHLADMILRLKLEKIEVLAFLLALAPNVNRKYERIFCYIQDDVNARNATAGLCEDLWSLVAESAGCTYALYDPDRPLNRFALENGGTGLSRELVLRKSTLNCLLGTSYLPVILNETCQWILPGEEETVLAHSALIAQSQQFAASCIREQSGVGVLQITGEAGTGKHFFLRQIISAVQHPILLLDCEKWYGLSDDQRASVQKEMVSWAYFHNAIPAFYHFFDVCSSDKAEFIRLEHSLLWAYRDGFPMIILCGGKLKPISSDIFTHFLHIHIPAPTTQQQERCWELFPQKRKLSPEVSPQQLATLYSLSFGQIRQVLNLAEAEVISLGQDCLQQSNIANGIRELCAHKLEALTEPILPAFTWDDLEVDDLAKQQLKELCDRIRNRWKVNEEWGFNKRLPYGKGISVCLYGPPGTGKTMTAQVLAREFGLDAYRVDMSRIMDKYIGETEKKLGELFDAAKDSNSILFFDEADALFAKRTEVGDSKDRYANLETAYLLQRMENHNGISILATNAMNNFDAAFKRRISYMISLPMPDGETRKKLWHKVFPREAPLAGVDLDNLAERFELTGSSIKNAALHAAYLAAAEGREIEQSDLLRAIQTEYQRTGRILMEADLY